MGRAFSKQLKDRQRSADYYSVRLKTQPSALSIARRFVVQKAHFDGVKKESVNSIDNLTEIYAAVKEAFPGGVPDGPVVPDGFEPVTGLVLSDPRGEGAFQ